MAGRVLYRLSQSFIAMSEDNKYHPSFVPLIEKINERGYRSPYAYVSFETKEGHVHHVPIGNGTDNLFRIGTAMGVASVSGDKGLVMLSIRP